MTAGPKSARAFRGALPADAPAIRSLLFQANRSSPAVGDCEHVTHQRMGEILTFVCEEEGKLLGILEWRDLGEEAEILDLAVEPQHRRQGLASFLLENFMLWLSRTTVRSIFLEVRESNFAAIALYAKFGFKNCGRRPNYYRDPDETALLMTASLRA
ncbi:MAG TPA: ribosomal protein S18-alanine N-acetyltransferase [Candidatus Acidoferrum sp.]|nr:ribosomal protein S18-alanine N-acetyltransferase [Candidatus Acidoferrum sp.]